MGRAPCCDKANVKKGPWSPEEDAKLKAYIDQNGTGGNWIALPQKIGLKRCGKSCRLRWLNYLRPNIKHGGFSEEEDNIICSLYISIGSRWSIIAAQLPGRTDNDIKNYWNTRLKKKLLGRRKDSQARRLSLGNQLDPQQDVINPMDSQTLSNSALERLQLHMQLQSIQHPFSFYNNSALWPKLHPLMVQKTMQLGHHEFNDNLMHQIPQTGTYQDQESLHELPNIAHLQRSTDSSKQQEVDHNSINGSLMSNPSSDNINSANNIPTFEATITQKYSGGDHEQFNENIGLSVSSLQAELKDLLVYSKTGGFEAHNDEFDCFKEMDWANNFDTKSSSSNSWDSATVVQPDGVLFQDYVLGGYDL